MFFQKELKSNDLLAHKKNPLKVIPLCFTDDAWTQWQNYS